MAVPYCMLYFYSPLGGQIYWKRKSAPTASQNPWSEPESVVVELTSYVLLAVVTSGTLSQEDKVMATGIVAWLAKQQNAYGGFASTQVMRVPLPQPGHCQF